MRVLVSGHKGYIGSVLVPLLTAAKHTVVGLDSDLYRDCTFGSSAPDIAYIRKDIRDIKQPDLKDFDAIIHLAGLSNDPLGDLNPELTYEINYIATVHLASTAKKAGVKRFIFSSSCSNYGAAGEDWVDERSKLNPVTPYGLSKVLAEEELRKLTDSNFSPIFPRNGTAFGVSPRLRFDLVLNNLVAWAFTTGKVHLKSDGMAWRPIVHIEDIARAFMAMLNAPRELVHNQVFNVGRTKENYRINTLAEIVRETVPGVQIEYAEGASRDKRCYRVSCRKLEQTLLEFTPQWTARRGAKQLHKAFKTIGLTLEEFEGLKYKRVAHLKHLLDSGRLDETMRWKVEDQVKYVV